MCIILIDVRITQWLVKRNKPIARKNRKSELKLSRKQLECLSSPVRVNLFEALRLRQTASVAELAADLNKSVHSLYYHVKTLVNVGLIRVCEHRRVGKRDEAVYEPVSDRLVFNKEGANPAYSESLIKTVRLVLRKAEREHQNARRAKVPEDQFATLRLQANLSPEDAKELRRKIVAMGKWVRKRDVSDRDSDAASMAITCLVVPLDSQPTNEKNR